MLSAICLGYITKSPVKIVKASAIDSAVYNMSRDASKLISY